MLFPKFVKEDDSKFISTSQVVEFLKNEAQMFAMFDSLKVESKTTMIDIPVVCEFLDVFPDDIIDLPLEQEIEFTIDFGTW